ncbi:PTS N-acetylgalactosamine transporter subunit IIC [Clostridiales bacterium COT073_COT-073]|nr:PTS N-acetylgalactosamine transporter subunit IIC [Clostridiales bacterium COT073_COT-073]
MSITLLQAFLLSLWAFLSGCDRMVEAFFWFRPIIVSTVVGIILGDPVNGAIVGGLTELAFAGLTPAGGAVPPDPVVAGLMGAVFACTGKISPTAAVGLALPFSILMQYIIVLMYMAYTFWMRPFDRKVEACDVKGIVRINIWGTLIAGVAYFIFAFLATYVIQDVIQKAIDRIPAWLMNGFEVAGGVMPALGFAMLLTVMYKTRYLPFLIVGFLAATYLNFTNILPVALIGCSIAMYNYFFGRKETGDNTVMEEGESNVGI